MLSFMRDGGWPMLLILPSGLLSLGAALRYVLDPKQERLPLIIGFGVVTILLGCLGTALGFQATLTASRDQLELIPIGARESLANAVLGFGLATATAFVTTLGAWWSATRPDHAPT